MIKHNEVSMLICFTVCHISGFVQLCYIIPKTIPLKQLQLHDSKYNDFNIKYKWKNIIIVNCTLPFLIS